MAPSAYASRPVVVLTALDDVTSDHVITELYDRGVPVVRFDPGSPDELTFSGRAGGGWSWHGPIATATRTLGLEDARAVYYRRPTPYVVPADQERDFAVAQFRHGLGGLLAALPRRLYVNHPHRNSGAQFKPRQITEAVAAGLHVPPTLITNDPAAARSFAKEYGPVVYKSLRSTTYREGGALRTVWVRTVEADEIGDGVAACPHLFQQAVVKTADVRVAAVGERLFATLISTDGDHLDWRLDHDVISCTPMAAADVPHTVRHGIRAYLKAFGLVFGAFDFALEASGAWHFLECNPNGQWAFVDRETTGAIASALADLLEKGPPP